MWTGDNLWHRTVICHNSNCMELELAPKGKDMSSLLVFSTLEAINLSLNIQKDHFFFQKSIPWGLYCLRKVIYTSAVRLRASKLHCPLLLRSEVGKRGSQLPLPLGFIFHLRRASLHVAPGSLVGENERSQRSCFCR